MSSINDEGDELDGVEECHIPSAATHLATDPYCFLCHRDLPGWPPVLKYGHDWEFDLVGLQELPSSLRVARVTHPHNRYSGSIPPAIEVEGAELCFAPHCRRRDAERPVHIAHAACWSVGRKVHGSLSVLFTHARTSRQIFPLRHVSGQRGRLTLPDLDYHESPLGALLRAVATLLPEEVCHIILEHLCDEDFRGKKLLMNLARASAVIPPYTRQVTASALPIWEKVPCRGPLDRLSIETSSVLGVDCISKITLGGLGSGVSVPLRVGDVRGVRFALHPYGLRAIRVLYDDGSMSSWLGSTDPSWFGEVHGTDLSQLHVLLDPRRVLRLSFGSATLEHPSPLSREMWNQECALDSDLNHTSVNYGSRGPSPTYYNGWGLRSYVDFGSGADYISGLTAYRCRENYCSVAYSAHGRRYELDGCRRDEDGYSALYLPLRQDERILSVWVSTRKSDSKRKELEYHELLVTTTLGRSHFFGICGLITFPRYGDFRWMCLVPPGAVCAGLSYDAEGAAVGASWRPGAGGPVVTPVGIYCELPGKLTLASLADTSKIEVRCVRESGWPLGALVTHSDGGAEALGDFQPGSCSCHPVTTLYEAAIDGPLLGLAFKYSRGSYGIVCAIEAVTPSSPAPDDWVVIGNMSTVAWSDEYMPDNVEFIEEWEGGEMVSVAERSPLPKISMGPDVGDWE